MNNQPEIKYINKQSEIERLEKENAELRDKVDKAVNAKKNEERARDYYVTRNVQFSKQLENLNQELKKKDQIIEKAESVIKFYSDISNWKGEDCNGWNSTNVIHEDDQETVIGVWEKGCNYPVEDEYDNCGGKQARQYFKDKDKE